MRALAAFAVVTAAPGEAVPARLRIPARAFDRYDATAASWVRIPGQFTVGVGRSSRDLPLSLLVPAG